MPRTLAFAMTVALCACDAGSGSFDAAVGVDFGNTSGDGGAGANEWMDLRPLPAPRQETAVVELGGYIYVIGGFDRNRAIVPTVERYDPKTNDWTTIKQLPKALHHANAAVVNGRIYVVGALALVGVDIFAAIGDIYEYDPNTNNWTPHGTMTPGTERGASLVAALNGEVFIAGGIRSGAAVADFSSWSPTTGQFTDRKPLPQARDHGVGAAVGGRFYTIGGRGGGIGSHTARVDAYDPALNDWSGRTPMPTSRGGTAGAVVNGRIVVAGGEGNASKPSGVFDQTEMFDPVTNMWTKLAPMKSPRHGTGAATIGNVFYMPGGASVEAFGAVATMESLVVE
jgi:N-acetylneuraminic acid mutarotase